MAGCAVMTMVSNTRNQPQAYPRRLYVIKLLAIASIGAKTEKAPVALRLSSEESHHS
jgi:hypothetical protein